MQARVQVRVDNDIVKIWAIFSLGRWMEGRHILSAWSLAIRRSQRRRWKELLGRDMLSTIDSSTAHPLLPRWKHVYIDDRSTSPAAEMLSDVVE